MAGGGRGERNWKVSREMRMEPSPQCLNSGPHLALSSFVALGQRRHLFEPLGDYDMYPT